MSDTVNVANRISTLDVSPQFDSYSKVIIHVSDDEVIEVGTNAGRTLEIDNPYGTQQMAQDILTRLQGYQYQPYTADGTIIDPANEIGDALNSPKVYGGIYARSTNFGRLMKADVSAPCDEEINHEYAFESPEQREFTRQINDVKASLIIANDRIDASVSQTGGNSSTFGWSLTSTGHRWYSGNKEVMAVTASGLSVTGTITATAGKIGNFNISASAIWNNISSFGGSQSSGVYLGTNGIQLGQNFKVDTSGNVTATRLTVDTLYIGGTAVSAANLNSRASQGSSAYSWTSSNGSYCSTGAGYGYNYKNAITQGSSYPSYFRAGALVGGWITANSGIITPAMTFNGSSVYKGSITINGTTYKVMRYN